MSLAAAAVVLAAGASQRMGRPKALLSWGDRCALGQAIATLRAAGVGEIAAVIRPEQEAPLASLLDADRCCLVINPRPDRGQFASLQLGLAALPAEVDAIVVALVDHPAVLPQTVAALLGAWFAAEPRVIIPTYQERRGHPILLPRSLRRPLLAAPENLTLAVFLSAPEVAVTALPVGDPAVLQNINTPADYDRQRQDDRAQPHRDSPRRR
ncbi:MAG: nucleotidyltransferase family protein [Candidatus Schekmanbacteria bacterium]|nr:nucleotidyltransferase family protein [Candidatus Schekmanbacteria bacterium]